MHLIIFDIDGTLIRSDEVESACFWSVMEAFIEVPAEPPDWDAFEHVTDEGIVRELLSQHHEGADLDAAVAEIRRDFVAQLRRELEVDGLEQVVGSEHILAHVTASTEHVCAIATGSWRPSAELKLRSAGLDATPLATSDDSPSRLRILELTRSRAGADAGCAFARVTYVGDGAWDVRAAAAAGIDFVGVADRERHAALRKAGARAITHDFRDVRAFLDLVEQSRSPRQS